MTKICCPGDGVLFRGRLAANYGSSAGAPGCWSRDQRPSHHHERQQVCGRGEKPVFYIQCIYAVLLNPKKYIPFNKVVTKMIVIDILNSYWISCA